MSNVVEFPTDSALLKDARRKAKLSLTQAVCALGDQLDVTVSPKTLETWESGASPSICPVDAKKAYRQYCDNAEDIQRTGKNLLFGSVPISAARDILGFSMQEIADVFDYKPSFWVKIEANSRFLPDEKLAKLESMLQDKFLEFCGGNDGGNTLSRR